MTDNDGFPFRNHVTRFPAAALAFRTSLKAWAGAGTWKRQLIAE